MKKILVLVEDEKSIAQLLQEQLEQEEIEVEVAFNGLLGMQKIKKYKPDLVLLDLLLPSKSGIEILREMREDPELKATPVIILSNISDSELMKEVLELKIEDYLIKSDHELEEVVKVVKKHITKT